MVPLAGVYVKSRITCQWIARSEASNHSSFGTYHLGKLAVIYHAPFHKPLTSIEEITLQVGHYGSSGSDMRSWM